MIRFGLKLVVTPVLLVLQDRQGARVQPDPRVRLVPQGLPDQQVWMVRQDLPDMLDRQDQPEFRGQQGFKAIRESQGPLERPDRRVRLV